jgi:hypothetical protein
MIARGYPTTLYRQFIRANRTAPDICAIFAE